MGRSPVADFLVPEGFAGPRGLLALAREGSVVVEAVRHRRHSAAERARLRAVPYAQRTSERVSGDPVLLIPGFLAGDYTLASMGRHLRQLGHRTYRTGILANVGCIDRGTQSLEQRLEQIAERRERKVTIVGHSLGGMMGRGLAARRPDLVGGLVTLGSPMLAPGAAHELLLAQLATLRRLQRLGLPNLMGEDCTTGSCALRMWDESRKPLPESFPFTAVYSKRDGIADWRACIDPSGQAREVRTSHIGMALDPDVLTIVVEALDQIQARPLAMRRPGRALPTSDVG
jgi:pimeloyl-ACP methyl ester carboxylesterase